MFTLLALAAAALVLIRSFITTSKCNLPRLGPPTLFGYVYTSVRCTLNYIRVVREGRVKYGGAPFVLPTMSGPMVVLGPEHIDFLSRSNDSIFSSPAYNNELTAVRQTMGAHLESDNYQSSVVRSEFNRFVPSFIPDLFEEATLTLTEMFKPRNGSDSITLSVFDTCISIIGRVSGRSIVGISLCRNQEYFRTGVRFAMTLVVYAHVLRWCPVAMRDTLYWVLSFFLGGKEGLKYLVPFMKSLLQKPDVEDKPPLLTELILKVAPEEEIKDMEKVAMRVMSINFASLHSSSVFLTHALFALASLSSTQVESIRSEIEQVLEAEGGWNKESIAGLRKIDSLLKEVGRMYPLTLLGVGHLTVQDGFLPDGSYIPKGYSAAIDIDRIHLDPEIYPDPEVFDPFRFSDQKAQDGSNVKRDFNTAERNWLPFGFGRHSCPGRFFVAIELKMILALLLLAYDISFPPGITKPPKNTTIEHLLLPNRSAELVFKPRACFKSDV